MMWDTITIMHRVKTGTDELGNNTYKMQAGKTMKARKNAPNVEQVTINELKGEPVTLDERRVDRIEHLFYLPKNQAVPPAIEYLKHRGQIYRVLSVEALTPRFIQVRAVHYENNDNNNRHS